MKKDIQPNYYQAKVRCACGNEFSVGSTQETIRLDICSACHPFFTGKQKFVDTAGRVDKFFRKYGEEAQRSYKKKKKRKRLTDEEVEAMENSEKSADDTSADTEPEAQPDAATPAEETAPDAADAATDDAPQQDAPEAVDSESGAAPREEENKQDS